VVPWWRLVAGLALRASMATNVWAGRAAGQGGVDAGVDLAGAQVPVQQPLDQRSIFTPARRPGWSG
jgi:hypothetical protein